MTMLPDDGASPRRFYPWELLGLFWMAFFLNQGDRQIFNAVLPLIRADLHASDVQLGWVATGFTLVYGLLVPLAGYLGDRVSRKWIVIGSLFVFSTGTLLTGLSGGLLSLLIFRSIATGAGEAFYYPAAASLIAKHHPRTEAQALSIHQTANYAGIVVSSWAMASVGERFGWRTGFCVFGAVGTVLALVMAFRLAPDRLANAAEAPEAKPSIGEVLRFVLAQPTVYCVTLAFGGMVFVGSAFMTWTPTYLYETFHLPLARAALQAVLAHHAFAFLGVSLGGRISDRVASRRPAIRLETCALGLMLGAPFIFLLGHATLLWVTYAALAGFGFFRGVYDSNLFSALYVVVPARLRATATGLMLATAFAIGATSPVLLAHLKHSIGLGAGLAGLSIVYVLSSAALLAARVFFFGADHARAIAPDSADRRDDPSVSSEIPALS